LPNNLLPTDDHFIHVYKNEAAAYHALIAAEDADGNLLPALQAITPLAGKRVLDLGSGRIPLLLSGLNCEIVSVDLHHAMLVEQAHQLPSLRGEPKARRSNPQESSATTVRLLQADLRRLPLAAGWAEVVTAGWAIGHFTGWYPASWKTEAARAIAEMQRAARPGGTLIILETLGTGVQQPAPPTAKLADYYAWLENEQGFTRQVISTDYDFGSVERAAELCSGFFGAELTARVRANGWRRVPEFTGIWFLSC
jgi:SAM-dependent methyltransferase